MTHTTGTDVFVSYKRDDEARVQVFVTALEKADIRVWWDRGIPAAARWRNDIELALESARVVIVVWTEASAGPDGDFVREEAERGKQRGVLIPVRFDEVRIPLGFGELQTTDLIAWRGSVNDTAFIDLVGAIHARLAGLPPPPPVQSAAQLSARRVRRRMARGFALAFVAAFLLNVFNLQGHGCAARLGQPWLGDLCGALSLGSVPSRGERLAWSSLDLHNCEALRNHLKEYPSGSYEAKAKALLLAGHRQPGDKMQSIAVPIVGYIRQSVTPFRVRTDAEADAVNRAKLEAQTECARVVGIDSLRTVDVQTLVDCRIDPRGGIVCGSNYSATCRGENRLEVERC